MTKINKDLKERIEKKEKGHYSFRLPLHLMKEFKAKVEAEGFRTADVLTRLIEDYLGRQ